LLLGLEFETNQKHVKPLVTLSGCGAQLPVNSTIHVNGYAALILHLANEFARPLDG